MNTWPALVLVVAALAADVVLTLAGRPVPSIVPSLALAGVALLQTRTAVLARREVTVLKESMRPGPLGVDPNHTTRPEP